VAHRRSREEAELRIVARITAKPDTVSQVREVLLGLVQPTRDERGCLSYTLLQNESDPADFTFVETWLDRKAFESHLETAHFKAAAAKLAPLAASPTDIRQYHVVT
jgi:quinol monooxygenase YgiN